MNVYMLPVQPLEKINKYFSDSGLGKKIFKEYALAVSLNIGSTIMLKIAFMRTTFYDDCVRLNIDR